MSAPDESDEGILMAQHGIRKMLVPRYLYRDYRYHLLSDAVAMALRDEARDPAVR